MKLSLPAMEKILMEQLRLYHHPVAVTWLFSDEEVEEWRRAGSHMEPVKPLTFCQWELAARMQNRSVLGTLDKLGCSSARISFGWQDIDEEEISAHLKYCVDREQAERFLRSKPRLPQNSLKGLAVSPLGQAVQQPHVVHFYCDNMQSYHLAVDYMAATDTHPLRPQVCMSSGACGGAVFSWQEKKFNMGPACSGSYNAGKTERGEVNVFIPGEHIGLIAERIARRVEATGGSALTRAGDSFPGGDICKNCPLIIFKKSDPAHGPCASCQNQDDR